MTEVINVEVLEGSDLALEAIIVTLSEAPSIDEQEALFDISDSIVLEF